MPLPHEGLEPHRHPREIGAEGGIRHCLFDRDGEHFRVRPRHRRSGSGRPFAHPFGHPEGDVRPHRVGEQERLLGDRHHAPRQLARPDVPDIHPVEPHRVGRRRPRNRSAGRGPSPSTCEGGRQRVRRPAHDLGSWPHLRSVIASASAAMLLFAAATQEWFLTRGPHGRPRPPAVAGTGHFDFGLSLAPSRNPRIRMQPSASPRTGKTPSETIADLWVLVEHGHPHRPETNRLREFDRRVDVAARFNRLARKDGLTPCLAALAPSEIAGAWIIRGTTVEAHQIEQVLRPCSDRLGKVMSHLDDSLGQVFEEPLGIVPIRPDVSAP